MAHAGRFIPGHDARSNILARGEAQFPSFGHRDVATRQHHARDRTHPLGGSNPKITKITRRVACEASFRCLAREVEIPDRACGERRSRLLHDDRGTEGGGSSTRRAPLGQVVVHERPDTRERWDSRERAGRCALRLHGWQAPHDESVGWILSGERAEFCGVVRNDRLRGVARYPDGATCEFSATIAFGIGEPEPNMFTCRKPSGEVMSEGVLRVQLIRLKGCKRGPRSPS